MLKKSLFSVLLGLSLLSSAAYAASPNTPTHVTYTGLYGSGRFFVAFDDIVDEPDCPGKRVDVGAQHAQIDNWLSIAKTALETGRTVMIRTNGCFGGYPTLDHTQSSWFYLR